MAHYLAESPLMNPLMFKCLEVFPVYGDSIFICPNFQLPDTKASTFGAAYNFLLTDRYCKTNQYEIFDCFCKAFFNEFERV